MMIKIYQQAIGYRRQKASVWRQKWHEIQKGVVL